MIKAPDPWRVGAVLYFIRKGKPQFLVFDRDSKNWGGTLMFGWGGRIRPSEKRLAHEKDVSIKALWREKREELNTLLPHKDILEANPLFSVLHENEKAKERSAGTAVMVRITEKTAKHIIKNQHLLKELKNPRIASLKELEAIHSKYPERIQPHYRQFFPIVRDHFASRRLSRT